MPRAHVARKCPPNCVIKASSIYVETLNGLSLNSPRAGGRYFISGSAAEMVAGCDERLKARLTSWLIDQRRSGIRCPEIMTSTIDDAARYRDLSVQERVDRFLGFIGGRSRRIGVTFSVAN